MGLTTNWGLQADEFIKKTRQGHPRERERWLAVYWLSQGIAQAEVARRLRRTRNAIQTWKENFEKKGPNSLNFRRSGGRKAFLSVEQKKWIANLVATQLPRDIGLHGIRWTLKEVAYYCQDRFGVTMSTETCRLILHQNRVALKHPKKN